jgi:hypothetical protein
MPGKRVFLPGIDYFQLLIDHHSKRKGGKGHEARLAIYLQGILSQSQVLETVSSNKICQQLSQARISKSFGLGYPSLYFTKTNCEIPITFHTITGNEIPDANLNLSVDIYTKPPLHLQVLYFENHTTCLLFTLHHILFDFAGVQALVASLSGDENVSLLPAKVKKKLFLVRFNSFFKAVFFTFREANSKMSVLENPLPNLKPFNTVYKEVFFTKDETNKIFSNCNESGLQLQHSIYFLAAVCKSLHENIFSKQVKHQFLWIPVPVNVRKRGSANAVVFNGLTFLFYKLNAEKLNDITVIQNSLRNQMKLQMQQKMPDAFVDFAEGYKFMPMPFYYPMMQLPSLGKLSSFSFSVLGDTFQNTNNFMGLPVLNIKNYPSNSTSPGITFLFYEFRGELKIMSSWVKGQYSVQVQDDVLKLIRNQLLNSFE